MSHSIRVEHERTDNETLATVSTLDFDSSPTAITTSEETDDHSIDENPAIKQLLLKRATWNSHRYGNRVVCCNGLVMVGPVKLMWWLLELLTIVTLTSFAIEYEKFHVAVVAAVAFIGGLFLVASFKTLCCNPGVIKKPKFQTALENMREVIRSKSGAPTKQVVVNDRVVEFRYCSRCHLYRPPKAVHCAVCDACVENFDHHCPVFGGCIGKKNFVSFELMIISVVLYYLILLAAGFVVAGKILKSQPEPSVQSIFSACITLDMVIIGAFLGCTLYPIIAGIEALRQDPPLISPTVYKPKYNKHNKVHPTPTDYRSKKVSEFGPNHPLYLTVSDCGDSHFINGIYRPQL